MLQKIVEISGLPAERLKPEIREVHRKHGTSEYSFLVEELPSLRAVCGSDKLSAIFSPAFDAYRAERRRHLRLYPTVADSILKIKGSGAKIIGYTESMAFYSNYRVRRLGLDGVFDYIFSPEDHDVPSGLLREQIRKYPAAHYEFKYTRQRHTPKGSKKPDALAELRRFEG
jgi:phosphoglycolate phosphatase-like HAD superfamily hydrolase